MWSPEDDKNRVVIVVPTPRPRGPWKGARLKLPSMFQMDSGSSYESYEAADSLQQLQHPQQQQMHDQQQQLLQEREQLLKQQQLLQRQQQLLQEQLLKESQALKGAYELKGGYEGVEGRENAAAVTSPMRTKQQGLLARLRILKNGKSHSFDSFDSVSRVVVQL